MDDKELSKILEGADEARKRFHVKYSGDGGQATANYVKTVDEAIEKCNIDLKVWEVYKVDVLNQVVYRKNLSQDMVFEEGKLSGYKIDHGDMTLEPLKNIKLYFRLRQFNPDLFIEKLCKNLKPPKPLKVSYKKNADENLLVVNLYDLHLDKLAFDSQVTKTITPEKTAEIAEEAINVLLKRSSGYSFKKVLFPVGHDFFNHDRIRGYAMTSNETPQHSAFNWEEMTILGGELLVGIIDRLSQVAPVDIEAVPGNHDANRAWHIAHYLFAWYRNNKNVSINLLGGKRRYYQWGKTLLGMTHSVKGSKKKQRLRSAMTNECECWSETKFRYWLLGDLHRESNEDVDGVSFEVLPSLAGNDLWHHDQAFNHMRSCKANFYHKEEGLIGDAVYNLGLT